MSLPSGMQHSEEQLISALQRDRKPQLGPCDSLTPSESSTLVSDLQSGRMPVLIKDWSGTFLPREGTQADEDLEPTLPERAASPA